MEELEDAVVKYFKSLGTDEDTSVMATGKLGQLERLLSSVACNDVIEDFALHIEHLATSDVTESCAAVAFRAQARFTAVVDRHPSLGRGKRMRKRVSRRYGGPVLLRSVSGRWLVEDYTIDFRRVVESTFTSVVGGGRFDSLVINVLGVELRHNLTTMYLEVFNSDDSWFRLVDAVLSHSRRRSLGLICSGVDLGPGEHSVVAAAWPRQLPLSTRHLHFWTDARVRDGSRSIIIDFPVTLTG